MAIRQLRIVVNLKGLDKFEKVLKGDLRLRSNGPIRKALQKWGLLYREWIHNRYMRYSRGGGNWPPITDAWAKRKGNNLILRETDFMVDTITPRSERKPGMVNKAVPFGWRVGFGSTATHPSSGLPLDIHAMIHQLGAGNNPSRLIIVPPSFQLKQKMAGAMQQGLAQLLEQSRI